MSTQLGESIKNIRENMGFASAKAFYNHLSGLGVLDFNYSYYLRIEKGKNLPSSKVINSICRFLSSDESEKLILAYCATSFPKNEYLFKKFQFDESPLREKPETPISYGKQVVLTNKQVFTLSKKNNYFLFNLLVLSRHKVSLKELQNYFGADQLKISIEELAEAKFLREESDFVVANTNEVKFPSPDNEEIKKLYKQFDEWDKEICQFYHFDSLVTKRVMRRISSRYMNIINSMINLVFEHVKTSEEVDQRHNEDVVFLNIDFMKGNIPG